VVEEEERNEGANGGIIRPLMTELLKMLVNSSKQDTASVQTRKESTAVVQYVSLKKHRLNSAVDTKTNASPHLVKSRTPLCVP
jgi:hypothetical protein